LLNIVALPIKSTYVFVQLETVSVTTRLPVPVRTPTPITTKPSTTVGVSSTAGVSSNGMPSMRNTELQHA